MMSNKRIIARNLLNSLAVIAISGLLTACSTSNFSYVSREILPNDPLYLSERPYNPNIIETEKKPMSFGALKFQQEGMAANEGNLFLLQRKKGVYQAETMLVSDKKKKVFFSIGIDYKKQAPVIGFRMQF
jgi:hypothetical protein